MSRVGLWDEPNPAQSGRRKRNQETSRRKPRSRMQNRRKLTGKLKWGIVLVCGVGVLILTWWLPQYQKIEEMNTRVADLEKRKLEIQATNQGLQEQINWLGTDAAVERLAREELGFVKPGEKVLIDLQSTGN